MKRSSVFPIARGWPIGALLLLCAMAGPALAAGSISGKVIVPATRSVSGGGVQVNATDSKFRDFRVTAEDDGTYVLSNLEAGTYTVVVTGKGMEPVVVKDLAVKDDQQVPLDFTLVEAKVYRIVKAPKPIPLTDDYYSASFADAAEIRVDEAWQIVLGVGTGDLESWDPTQVSGKFKLKYSDQALHMAADLTLKNPGAHNWPNSGQEAWDGNSIDFAFQDDPYNPTRADYDPDHNWQLVVGLGDTPVWKLFQLGYPPDDQNPPKEDPKQFVLRKVKESKEGELLRIDFPWSIFHRNRTKAGPIPAPADGQMSALDINLGGADPDVTKEEAGLKNRLSWSGFFENWKDPRILRPVIFTATP